MIISVYKSIFVSREVTMKDVVIKNRKYQYTDDIKNNDSLRLSFNKLCYETFGFDFESWYQAGYWSDTFMPHVLIDDDEVIANVTVNILTFKTASTPKTYIQIGTVMTKQRYRGKGCADFLMKTVIKTWKNDADSIYLYANGSVLDFYFNYDFKHTYEHQHVYYPQTKLTKQTHDFLPMSLCADNHQLLLELYDQGNPFTDTSLINNPGLFMFYCLSFFDDCLYYSKNENTLIIYDDSQNLIYDIFGTPSSSLTDLLDCFSNEEIHLGFTPQEVEFMVYEPLIEEDTYLLIYTKKENPFKDSLFMLPLLSHA